MKFTAVFAILATLATAVSALSGTSPFNTNAKRLAAGLSPLSPARRGLGTPTYGAKRGQPSSKPNACSTPVLCCDTVTPANAPDTILLLEDLGIKVPSSELVGITCSTVSGCLGETVCCGNNSFDGIVATECTAD